MQKLLITQEERNQVLKELTEQVTKAKTTSELESIKVPKDKTIFKNVHKPEIYISASNLEKMFALVNASSVECQWHGLVKRSETNFNRFFIYKILVFPQINSSASTDTDENEYIDWLMQLDDDQFQDLRFHGHSHVNMAVYSSSIDDTFQQDLLANIKQNDYYIFFVLNKKREICILVYDYLQNTLFETKDCKIFLLDDNNELIDEWAKKELKEKAQTKTYKYTKTSSYYKNLNASFYYEDDDTDWYAECFYDPYKDVPKQPTKKVKKKKKKRY